MLSLLLFGALNIHYKSCIGLRIFEIKLIGLKLGCVNQHLEMSSNNASFFFDFASECFKNMRKIHSM